MLKNISLDKTKENLKKITDSKNFKKVICIFGAVFILFFVFQIGMMAGFRKASFSNNWGGNYERNFGPMHRGPQFMNDNFRELPNAHGAIGKIIKVEFPNIVVLDKDQTEKVIIVSDKTDIIERKEKVSKDSLIVDKFIIVIGSPNDAGQIESKLIRIIPSPEEMINGSVSTINDEIKPDFNNGINR